MPTTNYLPGVIVNTLDGGLTATFAPQDDSILILGTAGTGVVNTPYQVTDRALAAQTFGFAGTLERSIEECATYSDNVLAFRIDTTPMSPPMLPPVTRSGARPVCSVCGKLERWNTENDYVPSVRRNRNFPRAGGPGPDPPGRGWQ